jgi:hypothetical protein
LPSTAVGSRRARSGSSVLHILGQLTTEAPTDMTATPQTPAAPDTTTLDPATRRKLAADLFNHTWTLLEKQDRTAAEDDEMIHSAHASRYHRGEVDVGEPVNLARGEWQCSRVYACSAARSPHSRAPLRRDQRGRWPIGTSHGIRGRPAYLTAGGLAATAAGGESDRGPRWHRRQGRSRPDRGDLATPPTPDLHSGLT